MIFDVSTFVCLQSRACIVDVYFTQFQFFKFDHFFFFLFQEFREYSKEVGYFLTSIDEYQDIYRFQELKYLNIRII